jgi:DNA-binding NarL/FixJ family response regulator
LEATKRIRQLESELTTGTPVRHKIVGMSANSDYETSVHAIQAGADIFLPKPFNVDAIKVLFAEFASVS